MSVRGHQRQARHLDEIFGGGFGEVSNVANADKRQNGDRVLAEEGAILSTVRKPEPERAGKRDST